LRRQREIKAEPGQTGAVEAAIPEAVPADSQTDDEVRSVSVVFSAHCPECRHFLWRQRAG